MKRIFIAFALLLGTYCAAQSQSLPRLPFLRTNNDARSAAMGGAPTTQGMHLYNLPAGVHHNVHTFSLGYNVSAYPEAGDKLFDGGVHHNATASMRFGGRHAVMAGFRSLQQPAVALSNGSGATTNSYRPLDWAADLGYAIRLGRFTPWVRAGYVQTLTDRVKRAINTSVGVYFTDSLSLCDHPVAYGLGAAVHDFGTPIAQDKLDFGYMPTSIEVNGHLSFPVAYNNTVTLAAYAHHFTPLSDAQWLAGGGAEFDYQGLLQARAGFQHVLGENYFTFGLGCRVHGVGLNLAYTGSAASTSTYNRLSLGLTYQF